MTTGGVPHVIKTPYTPNTLYNPTSISNFIKQVARTYSTISDKPSAAAKGQLCLGLLGGKALVDGSQVDTFQGAAVRWFPYMFEFRANPGVAPLKGPWHSGLAQGGVLGAFIELTTMTGDNRWMTYGAEAFESFMVPFGTQGGITNRQDGFLWFEEYPTDPPTVVLNGHLHALASLDMWHARTGDARAKALFDEAMGDLEPLLEAHDIEIEGGVLASYDAVRGYPTAQLRLVGEGTVSAATHNGRPVTLPVVPTAGSGNLGTLLTVNSALNDFDFDGVPEGWQRVGSASHAKAVMDGTFVLTTNGKAWQGLSQVIPASRMRGGEPLALRLRADVDYPSGREGARASPLLLPTLGRDHAPVGEHHAWL